jgi:hypothetical protein
MTARLRGTSGPMAISARDGEFGKSWTRVIGHAVYWFKVSDTPVGRRVMVMRVPLRGDRIRRYIHTLYDCDPGAFEDYLTAKWALPARKGDGR